MEVRLIQRGDRGLFISNGNKLLFPDKSWTAAGVGFAKNIEIVKDKGTYAFVRGEMLETLPIGVDDMITKSTGFCQYRLGKVEGQPFIAEHWSGVGGYRAFVKVEYEEGKTSIEEVKLVGRTHGAWNFLFECSKDVDMTEQIMKFCQVLNFQDDYEYFFTMVKLLQLLYDKHGFAGRTKLHLRVYNSSLVCVEHGYTISMPDYAVYRYVGEIGQGKWEKLENLPYGEDKKLYQKAEDIDMQELSDMAMEYGVCIQYDKIGDRTFDERLSCKVFEGLGSGVVVYAFNMRGYGPEWFETEEAKPYMDLVDESFERLEYLKRRLAKTGAGVEKLTGFNLRGWLMPFERSASYDSR